MKLLNILSKKRKAEIERWRIFVEQNPKSIKDVPSKLMTREIGIAAISNCPMALMRMNEEDRTRELCLLAIKGDEFTMSFVPDKYFNDLGFCLDAIDQNRNVVHYMSKRILTEIASLCNGKDDTNFRHIKRDRVK